MKLWWRRGASRTLRRLVVKVLDRVKKILIGVATYLLFMSPLLVVVALMCVAISMNMADR